MQRLEEDTDMKKIYIIVLTLILVFTMVFAAGCGDKASEDPAEEQQETVLSDDENAAY